MSNHEIKTCPRCGKSFECKPGNITQCQCAGVVLTDAERSFVAERFNDCLCIDCLRQLKNQVEFFKEKFNR
ncbi:MAG TPA: cysteine-rich CWC family protein [Chitinophagaceae bacterium]|jgi:hypothetical protein|nr:cysteine-rich CWC family protein [Chitinophagaceae bacterium]